MICEWEKKSDLSNIFSTFKHSQGFEHKKSLKYSFVLIHAKFYEKYNTIDPTQKRLKYAKNMQNQVKWV